MRRTVAITVRQLVETPHLGTRFHCRPSRGRAGDQLGALVRDARPVALARAVRHADDQRASGCRPIPTSRRGYVDRLADAGISAIAVGEDVGGAGDLRGDGRGLGAAGAADPADRRTRCRSPRWRGSWPSRGPTSRSGRRLHEDGAHLRVAAHGDDRGVATPSSLFDDLGAELGCRLEVLDVAAWRNCVRARRAAAAARSVTSCATRSSAAPGHLPAILRLDLVGQRRARRARCPRAVPPP